MINLRNRKPLAILCYLSEMKKKNYAIRNVHLDSLSVPRHKLSLAWRIEQVSTVVKVETENLSNFKLS